MGSVRRAGPVTLEALQDQLDQLLEHPLLGRRWVRLSMEHGGTGAETAPHGLGAAPKTTLILAGHEDAYVTDTSSTEITVDCGTAATLDILVVL